MYRFAPVIALLAMFASARCLAAEWKSLDVIDAGTVCLKFDELVSVDWGKLGGGMKDQKIVTEPMDLTKASQLGSYTIDGAAATAVGRKTRPHTFVRANNKNLTDQALSHEIYLTLDKPLTPGAKLTITLADGLTTRGPKQMSLTFDPATSRTEAIHADQLGYLPGAIKVAYVAAWLGDLGKHDFVEGTAFHVLDAATHKSAFEGQLKLRKAFDQPDNAQPAEGNHWKTNLYECDFTAFKTPGKYVVSVDGVGCSYPFEINADIYRQAYITLMRGLYHQRCGIELKEPYTEWTRPACHTGPLIQTDHRYMDGHFSEGPRSKFNETGETRTNVWGGWHDAADWDREELHADIPSKLLLAYELTPDHYADGELNIPESGNGIPDVVDEAAWGVDYYRRIQRPNGGVSVGMWESGSPKDGETSWTDTLKQYMYAEEPVCSYKQAAAAAHMVITLKKLGREKDAGPYLDSALRAFKWAGENLRPGDEAKVLDDRFHAAAALYRATGETKYQDIAKQSCAIKNQWEPLFNYPNRNQTLAAWTFALAEDDLPGLDKKFRDFMRKASIQHAQNDIKGGQLRGDRAAYNWWFPMNWGRGSQVDNFAIMMAQKFNGDAKLTDTMVGSANVTLGANPLNMTWVVGLGQHYPHQVMQINYWYDPKGPNPGTAPPGPFAYDPYAKAGVWQIGYAWKYVYPDVKQWPPLELWFEDRLCPPTNEHVVERMACMAMSFGYLCQPIKPAAQAAAK